MKTTILTLALLLSFFATGFTKEAASNAPVADSTTYKLTITISGVNNRTGKLYVGLATNEATFKGSSAKTKAVDVPASGEISVTFDGLPAGRYAVRVYQDLNNNQKMDFENQMPAEPFGFSNVTMLMGPPSFDQCAFDLNDNKSIQVSMIEM